MSFWDTLPYAAATLAILTAFGSRVAWLRSRPGSIWQRSAWLGLAGLAGVVALIASILAVASFWYTHRTQPSSISIELFEGVTYRRIVRQTPRPLVIHLVTVDLKAEGLRFLVTPPDPSSGRMLRARKTTDFLDEFGLQVAINANFFYPFASNTPWDYYPRPGDPVDVCGIATSMGRPYATNRWADGTLYLTRDNRARIDDPPGPVENAIAGNGLLVKNGRVVRATDPADLYPRAALGLDRDARTLILLTIDGKQPHYSEGATIDELSALMLEIGASDAIRLDEGGSATLAAQGPNRRAVLLNSPINSRIPGSERPVANHLGIFARPKKFPEKVSTAPYDYHGTRGMLTFPLMIRQNEVPHEFLKGR